MKYKPIVWVGLGILVAVGIALVWPDGLSRPRGAEATSSTAGDAGPSPSADRLRPSTLSALVDGRRPLDYAELLAGPVASDAELQDYLEKRGRSREALVAVGLLAGDDDLLREAAERFPDDPQLQFLAISRGLFPDRQREWVERFKAAQPDNSLAAYFMAGEHFKSGDTAAALAELRRGAGLDSFRDFAGEAMEAMESAALDLGHRQLDAKLRSTFGLEMPYLKQFRETIAQLERVQGEAGRPEEAAKLAAIGAAIGNDLSQGSGNRLVINQAIGMSIEQRFLESLDPDGQYPYFADTPGVLLAQIEADRKRMVEGIEGIGDFETVMTTSDEGTVLGYLERIRLYGEVDANEWLRLQLGDRGDR